MDRLDQIESLRGTGPVYRDDGQFVRDLDYDIQVLQEVHETRQGDVPGLKQIVGTVALGEQDVMLVGEKLVLHLPDGRCLDFFCTDADGSIANRGGRGLYRP